MKNKLIKKITTAVLAGTMLVSAFVPGMTVKAAETDSVPIYRLYNPDNGEHLYTTDENERNVLFNAYGWGYEGVAWYSSTEGTPVYRLYNNVLCNHLYTTDTNEVKVLTSMPDGAWTIDNNEQPLFYSSGDVPIYRVYNRELQGMHHLTTDKNEYDTLPVYGWTQEGVSLYAAATGNPIVTMYSNGGSASIPATDNTVEEKPANNFDKPMFTLMDIEEYPGYYGFYSYSDRDWDTDVENSKKYFELIGEMNEDDSLNSRDYKEAVVGRFDNYNGLVSVRCCKKIQ